MSSGQDSVRQFSIGRWSLRLLYFLFFVGFLGALAGIGYGIHYKTELQDKLANNEQLEKKVEKHNKEMQDLHKEMQDIREMANMVRDILGLNQEKGVLEQEEGILGQGGDGFDTEAVNDKEQTDSTVETRFAVITIDADPTGDSPAARISQLKQEIEPVYEYVKGKVKELNETPSILPISVSSDGETQSYWYSSGFGYRTHPLTKKRQFHNGLDISTRRGIPVIATANGVIIRVRKDRFLGNMVQIKHESTKMETLYGHLSKFAKGIRKGKKVKRYDVIGYVGNTGQSTGTHLHYGVRIKDGWKNPKNYILDLLQSR